MALESLYVVNTTGTGSVKGDATELIDIDSTSEMSFSSADNLVQFARSIPGDYTRTKYELYTTITITF
jgi:hypothetical protein